MGTPVQLNLAHAHGGHHRTLLQCIFSALYFLLAVSVRVGKTMFLLGGGLMLHLSFGLQFLHAQHTWPAHDLWKEVLPFCTCKSDASFQ